MIIAMATREENARQAGRFREWTILRHRRFPGEPLGGLRRLFRLAGQCNIGSQRKKQDGQRDSHVGLSL